MSQLDQHHGTQGTWRHVLPCIALLICVLGVLACGCTQKAPATSTPAPTTTAAPPVTTPASLANPAADHCHNMMGTYQIRTKADGSQYGVCILPNNQVCDAVKYMQQCVCTAPA